MAVWYFEESARCGTLKRVVWYFEEGGVSLMRVVWYFEDGDVVL